MGLFKAKVRLASKPRTLKQGTEIAVVDVDPGFVEWARASKPLERKNGHAVTVRVDLVGNDIEVRAGDGTVVAKMDPNSVPLYLSEFQSMQKRDLYGVTEILIKPNGWKSSHALRLNWGTGAVGGGIL